MCNVMGSVMETDPDSRREEKKKKAEILFTRQHYLEELLGIQQEAQALVLSDCQL